MKTIVEVRKLSICYGRRPIVYEVSFTVQEGQLVAIVGPNGAGKTTILKAIGGLIRPVKGEIIVNGKNTEKMTAQELLTEGVAYIPEGMSIFPQMSVKENLEIGGFLSPKGINERLEEVFSLFPELKEKKKSMAGKLSGGEQRMVTIGRGLMTNARILLLDDPFLGLSPKVTKRFCEAFRELQKRGKTLIVAGQHVRRLLNVADKGFLIEDGHLSLEGSGQDLLKDPHLKQVLFGHVTSFPEEAKLASSFEVD